MSKVDSTESFVDQFIEFYSTVASTIEEPANREFATFLFSLLVAKNATEWQIPCSLAPQLSTLQY